MTSPHVQQRTENNNSSSLEGSGKSYAALLYSYSPHHSPEGTVAWRAGVTRSRKICGNIVTTRQVNEITFADVLSFRDRTEKQDIPRAAVRCWSLEADMDSLQL